MAPVVGAIVVGAEIDGLAAVCAAGIDEWLVLLGGHDDDLGIKLGNVFWVV